MGIESFLANEFYSASKSQTFVHFDFLFFPAKILGFYTIFYGVLAALVAVCMWVFFQTLDPRIPKWRLDESLIGTNPGEFTFFLIISLINRNVINFYNT